MLRIFIFLSAKWKRIKRRELRRLWKYFFRHQTRKLYKKTADGFEVPRPILRRRLDGIGPRKDAQENNQSLSNYQERLLEAHLIFLA